MNRKLILAVLTLIGCYTMHADVWGKSFLTLRQRFELNLPERINMFRTRMDDRTDGIGGALQVVGFYGQTSNPPDIARYFLPNDKDYVIIGEDTSTVAINNTRDVNAFNLGIATSPIDVSAYNAGFTHLTFASRLSFCPKQTTYGIGFTYQHRLPNHFWIDAAAPVICVKNNLGLNEDIQNRGGGQIPSG